MLYLRQIKTVLMLNETNYTAIVLFDGVCNLCNSSINFIIRHDKKNRFMFAALQSEKGIEILKQYGFNSAVTNSIVLIKNKNIFLKSSAALQIAKSLNGLFPALYIFMIIPPFIRNIVYDFIAANRYKWFGKKEVCMIPTEELKSKFIS